MGTRFNVRIQLSDTEEHIYTFEVASFSDNIRYCGYLISRRNDINDIWGYDWCKHFQKKKDKLLELAETKSEIKPDGDYWLEEIQQKVLNRYNPVYHKTKSGQPYLYGSFSSKPDLKPLVSEEYIKEIIAARIKDMKVIL